MAENDVQIKISANVQSAIGELRNIGKQIESLGGKLDVIVGKLDSISNSMNSMSSAVSRSNTAVNKFKRNLSGVNGNGFDNAKKAASAANSEFEKAVNAAAKARKAYSDMFTVNKDSGQVDMFKGIDKSLRRAKAIADVTGKGIQDDFNNISFEGQQKKLNDLRNHFKQIKALMQPVSFTSKAFGGSDKGTQLNMLPGIEQNLKGVARLKHFIESAKITPPKINWAQYNSNGDLINNARRYEEAERDAAARANYAAVRAAEAIEHQKDAQALLNEEVRETIQYLAEEAAGFNELDHGRTSKKAPGGANYNSDLQGFLSNAHDSLSSIGLSSDAIQQLTFALTSLAGSSQNADNAYGRFIDELRNGTSYAQSMASTLSQTVESGNAFSRIGDAAKAVFGRISGVASRAFETIRNGVYSAEDAVYERFPGLEEVIDPRLDNIKATAANAFASMRDSAQNAFNSISNGASGIGQRIGDAMARAREAMAEYAANNAGNASGGAFGGIVDKIKLKVGELGAAFNELSPKASKAFSLMGSAGKAALGGIQGIAGKIKGELGNALGGIQSAISRVFGMARNILLRQIIRGIYSAIGEGTQALANYSSSFNNTMSSFQSSLLMLRNAFTAAFAPILSYVAPVLNVLIQKVAQAFNVIAKFISALTGKSYATIAVKPVQSYAGAASNAAKSTGDTAKATKKANKAAKEYKNTLMGFDKIEKLNDTSDTGGDSGGTGGGGGGGGGGVGTGAMTGSMFDTVGIDKNISDFADKVKEAWKKADFTEIGEIVGNKIANALNSIDWDRIQFNSKKLGKSLATFFNGINQSELAKALGHTLAQSFNTAVYFLEEFVVNFSGDSFGKAIATFFKTAIKETDWKAVGVTLSYFVTDVLDTVSSFIENLNPDIIVGAVEAFLSGINWKKLANSVLRAIKALFKLGKISLDVQIDLWVDLGLFIIKKTSKFGQWLFQKIWDITMAPVDDPKPVKMDTKVIANVDMQAKLAKSVSKFGKWILKLLGLSDNTPSNEAKTVKTRSNVLHSVKVQTKLGKKLDKFGEWVLNALGISTGKSSNKNKKADTTVGATVNLFKGWKGKGSVADWVRRTSVKPSDNVKQKIRLKKDDFDTIQRWVQRFDGGPVSKAIGVKDDGWGNISSWIQRFRFGNAVSKAIGVIDNGWGNIGSWIGRFHLGGPVTKAIGIIQNDWTDISSWIIRHHLIGRGVSVGVSLIVEGVKKGWKVGKSVWSHIKAALGFAEGGILVNGSWHPVQQFAAGGLPNTGQMFIARESGPELVGKIGHNTAVVNNNQIVASVSDGVFRAVVAAMSRQNSNVNVYLQGDAGKIFKLVQRKARQYTNSTGLSPFPV